MYSFKGYKFYNHLQEIREISVVKDAITHEILTEYITDGNSIIKIDDIFMICKNIDVQIMEEDEKIWLLINEGKGVGGVNAGGGDAGEMDSDNTITTDETASEEEEEDAADNKNNDKNYLLWESIQTHNHFESIHHRMDNIFRLEEKKNVLLSRL
jgi:hypothetical protein